MAHMLEERGLATTVIASVLPQVEKTRPPRAVFVPFMLGRPLGEPNDPAFQRRVLMQALGLLERPDGPVILEQFPDDNPSWFDQPDWKPAVDLPVPGTYQDASAWEAAFRFWQTAWFRCERRSRSTEAESLLDCWNGPRSCMRRRC